MSTHAVLAVLECPRVWGVGEANISPKHKMCVFEPLHLSENSRFSCGHWFVWLHRLCTCGLQIRHRSLHACIFLLFRFAHRFMWKVASVIAVFGGVVVVFYGFIDKSPGKYHQSPSLP